MPSPVLASSLLVARLLAGAATEPTCHDAAGQVIPCTLAVTYLGGPVVQNPKVHAVFWGDAVDPEVTARIGDFYATVVDSDWIDWLAEYRTDVFIEIGTRSGLYGPAQLIGRGTYAGAFAIAPGTTTACTPGGPGLLHDDEIEAELAAQVRAGRLPPPEGDSVYALHLPAGCRVNRGTVAAPDPAGDSCAAFCSYHATFPYGAEVPYLVVPDMGHDGCQAACGPDPSFDRTTAAASAALVGVITDPQGFGAPLTSYPRTWSDIQQGEIGDLCRGHDDVVGGYRVQQAFSLRRWRAGLAGQPHIPACISSRLDFAISLSPKRILVAPGALPIVTVGGGHHVMVEGYTSGFYDLDIGLLRVPGGVVANLWHQRSLSRISLGAGNYNSGQAGLDLALDPASPGAGGVLVVVVSDPIGGQVHTASLLIETALPPEVQLTGLGPDPVAGVVALGAVATPAPGHVLTGVALRIDGVAVGAGLAPAASWDTTKVPDGDHLVEAVATDAAGLSATAARTVAVNNVVTPPAVSIVAPAASTVSGAVPVVVEALPSPGTTVASTTVTLDGAPLVRRADGGWDTTGATNGPHRLRAEVLDADGGSAAAEVAVTVANRPAVAFLSPAPQGVANPTVVSGQAAVALSIWKAKGAAIASATLAVGGLSIPLGLDGVGTWDTTLLPDGPYTLTATVVDDGGLSTATSAMVVVNNQVTPPTVRFLLSEGATVAGMVRVDVQVAPSPGTTVAWIGFQLDGRTSGGTGPTWWDWDSTTVPDGQHVFTASVLDADGGTASARVTLNVANHAGSPGGGGGCSTGSGGGLLSGLLALLAAGRRVMAGAPGHRRGHP